MVFGLPAELWMVILIFYSSSNCLDPTVVTGAIAVNAVATGWIQSMPLLLLLLLSLPLLLLLLLLLQLLPLLLLLLLMRLELREALDSVTVMIVMRSFREGDGMYRTGDGID